MAPKSDEPGAACACHTTAAAPWPRWAAIAASALAANAAAALAGFIACFAASYQLSENYYAGVWLAALALMFTAQACVVARCPAVATGPRRFAAWLAYAGALGAASIVVLVGMGAPGMARQYAWAFTWWAPLAAIAASTVAHRRAAAAAAREGGAARVNVEAGAGAEPARPRRCSPAAWRRCWANYWAFVAWSSMFWGAFLVFFLALQAAWLFDDARRFPPPGALYPIDLSDGSGYAPRLHIMCKGPTGTGLATFVMEAGGGAPGVEYAGVADELAAAGRRACWYDRLGYGWSDAPRALPAGNQSSAALHALLAAAGEAPPFIIAGHSAGGQLAITYAGMYPSEVAGIALLDSYNDVAIALGYKGSANITATLPSGRVVTHPAYTYLTASTLSLVDVLRAVTSLGWARFITTSYGSYPYIGAANAMYGNNKEWQAQWYWILAAIKGVPDMSDILSDLAGRSFWHGTGWPSLGAKPVLLLPAENTLRPGMPEGCALEGFGSDAACNERVHASAAPASVYPSLYLTYLSTLSTNATMTVMPGSHSFPTEFYKETAREILSKFAGV